jgi:YgiT-type zinc finger domain-containing protein
MRCRVCGGLLEPRATDLPFKIGDSSIVIVKALPVLQCRQCCETEVEHATMLRVGQVLAGIDTSSELEVIPVRSLNSPSFRLIVWQDIRDACYTSK